MSLYFYRFSLIVILLSLSACGGGSGGAKNTAREVVYADADNAYTGERTQAKLTEENGMEFVKAFFADNLDGKVSLPKNKSSKSGLSGLKAQKSITTLGKKSFSTQMNMKYRASKAESEACSGGGLVTVTEQVDEKTNTGALFMTMNNCIEDEVTMNGEILIHVTEYSNALGEPTTYVLSFDNVSMIFNGETYTVIGTQSYSNSDTYYPTIVTTLLQIDSKGKQVLTKVKVKEEISGGKSYLGRFYIEEHGYVDITTPKHVSIYQSSDNFTSIDSGGEMLLSGVSSHIKITSHNYTRDLRIDLDENGDDIYELRAIQGPTVDWATNNFSFNKSPNLSIRINYVSPEELKVLDSLRVNRPLDIQVAAEDPEGQSISLEWFLELSPSDSVAQLTKESLTNNFIAGVYQRGQFIPDIVGEYRVNVKATDADGFSSVEAIEFTVFENHAPIAVISDLGNTVGGGNIRVGTPVYLSAKESSDLDQDHLNYYWEISSKPSGSAINLSLGDKRRSSLTGITLDVVGTYVFSLRVVDYPSGADDNTSVTIDVLGNRDPKAVITEITSKPHKLGDRITLFAFGESSDPDKFQRLSYGWKLKSKPLRSSLSILNQRTMSILMFTPDVAGSYAFELKVSDGYGGVDVDSITIEIAP